jgi:hypothetical protein
MLKIILSSEGRPAQPGKRAVMPSFCLGNRDFRVTWVLEMKV